MSNMPKTKKECKECCGKGYTETEPQYAINFSEGMEGVSFYKHYTGVQMVTLTFPASVWVDKFIKPFVKDGSKTSTDAPKIIDTTKQTA